MSNETCNALSIWRRSAMLAVQAVKVALWVAAGAYALMPPLAICFLYFNMPESQVSALILSCFFMLGLWILSFFMQKERNLVRSFLVASLWACLALMPFVIFDACMLWLDWKGQGWDFLDGGLLVIISAVGVVFWAAVGLFAYYLNVVFFVLPFQASEIRKLAIWLFLALCVVTMFEALVIVRLLDSPQRLPETMNGGISLIAATFYTKLPLAFFGVFFPFTFLSEAVFSAMTATPDFQDMLSLPFNYWYSESVADVLGLAALLVLMYLFWFCLMHKALRDWLPACRALMSSWVGSCNRFNA